MGQARASVGPRVRVLYLLAVAVGVFLLVSPWAVAAVLVLQLVAWPAVGLPLRRLGRQVFKLWTFTLFIVASYSLFALDPSLDRWVDVAGLQLNVHGALQGATMVMRVVAVVLASQVVRAGDPRAISTGMTGIGVPRPIAQSLDVVLALLGEGTGRGRGQGGGGGGGGGGGRGRRQGQESFWESLRRLSRGDVAPLVKRLLRHIDRAREHAGDGVGHDVPVVAGVALTMMAIKVLKLLPSLPFAPGHKLVLLSPLYIAAGLLTRGRFGASVTGLVMGLTAFLMGDGRYGIFEVLKHIAPGLVCDLALPWMRRGSPPRAWAWAVLGLGMGLGRFLTIFSVTLAVQPPVVAYAFLVPGIALNGFFGLLSGWVSCHVATALVELTDQRPQGTSSNNDKSAPEGEAEATS